MKHVIFQDLFLPFVVLFSGTYFGSERSCEDTRPLFDKISELDDIISVIF
jgi:hypothetical protein